MTKFCQRRLLPLLFAGSVLLAGSAWPCVVEATSIRLASQSGASSAAAPAAPQDATPLAPANWGSNPTPGALLEFKEIQRTDSSKGTKITYHLAASGFPAGKTYALWTMQSGDRRIFHFLTGYSADESGKLVCPAESQPGAPAPAKSRCIPFENISLDIDGYHYAEPLDFAIASTDWTVRAYAHTYPFPIQAQDGKCTMHVELENKKFNMYTILAEGFEPGEKVSTASSYGKGEHPDSVQASPQGKFAAIILINVPGKNSGSGTFTAAGTSCKLAVTYDWGKAASKVQ